MAIPKIIGTETEFGITIRNDSQFDPISTSILLVNSYQHLPASRVLWDYELENPLADARGFELDEEITPPSQKENLAINKILTNGARFYVDHAHPEFSTPECASFRDVVIYEKAGERIVDFSRANAAQILPPHQEIIIYKNNSDRKGNSYGSHENYLVDRATPFQRICDQMIPFLVSRQIYTGAGKVGAENGAESCTYQLSQRADFFETEIGLDTMAKRPIINTRDEPHADKKKYRRLHVIVGDSNMSEFAIYLKVGVTAVMLQLIEDDVLPPSLKLRHPVNAMRQVSRDLTCRRRLQLDNGKQWSPLELQGEYLNVAQRYCAGRPTNAMTKELLARWEATLGTLADDPLALHGQLDWVSKHRLLEAYRSRKGTDWTDHRLFMMDLQYHDTRKDRGLYYLLEREGKMERLVTDDEILRAIDTPPSDTRAFFRGEALKRYKDQVFGVNWDSISFVIDGSPIKRVIMAEPLKGTRAAVLELLDSSPTAAELIENLSP